MSTASSCPLTVATPACNFLQPNQRNARKSARICGRFSYALSQLLIAHENARQRAPKCKRGQGNCQQNQKKWLKKPVGNGFARANFPLSERTLRALCKSPGHRPDKKCVRFTIRHMCLLALAKPFPTSNFVHFFQLSWQQPRFRALSGVRRRSATAISRAFGHAAPAHATPGRPRPARARDPRTPAAAAPTRASACPAAGSTASAASEPPGCSSPYPGSPTRD